MLNLVFFILLYSCNVFAFPKAPFDALETPEIIKTNLNSEYDFEGIVKLSNCSGSLIKFSGQSNMSNAYVLTNGHCIGGRLLRPGEVISDWDVKRKMKVATTNMVFKKVNAQKLVYATLTKTDIAIYELEETYQEILEMGIRPFEFDSLRPMLGTDIEIVSGYWERGYSCSIESFVHTLREGIWSFSDSIRYSEKGCEVIGGTSGSPIIEKDSRRVIGINNTGNKHGGHCSLNNPCEVDENGEVLVIKGRGYGQQTYDLYNCLTPDFQIDLNLDTCDLPK